MDKTIWLRILEPDVIVFVVAIVVAVVAIISATVVKITKMCIRHRERISMIEHGIHPDYAAEDQANSEP